MFKFKKKYKKVIDDCSRAIELNPKYLKCIQRRARAAEKINDMELALEGSLLHPSQTSFKRHSL